MSENINANAKEYEGYNFIDTQTKSNTNFMQHLANLAASDSKHDFGQEYVKIKDDNLISNIYNTGIPKSFDKVYDESGSIKSVLQNGNKTLQEMFPGDTKTINFDIKHLEQESGKVLHRYTGIKEYIKNNSVYNEGGQFVKNCNLSNIILVIDFNQNGFLSMLKNGTEEKSIKMYYVMIPELENDPAGKTPVDDKLFKRETGVDLRAMIDITDKTIVYNEYDMNSEIFYNNFFSNYNFQLSPIISTKGISGKVTSKSVSLNIFKKNTLGNVLNQSEIKNCKKENSIDSLLKFLKNFFKIISGNKKSDSTSDFNYNVKLQQKRSGDWFQVLACLDIYNRKFKDYNDPNKDINFTKQNNNVYFVTHDQIACGYALIMGVNVIFINDKNAYVLTNDETSANEISPLERLFNNYQPNIWSSNEEINVQFTDMRKFLDEYKLLRDDYLDKYKKEIDKDINELYNKIVPTLPASPSLTCNNEKEADSYMEIIKNLFHNCVLYSNIKMSLPDPTNIISDLNNDEYLNAFKEYNVSNSDKINIIVNSYNKAISIKNQHTKESIVWQTSKWENLLKKSDAYTSVSDWVWKKKISSRIKSFFTSGTTSRKNDIYLFLSFIDTIDETIAQQITEVFDKYRQIVNNTKTGQNAWSNKNNREDYIKNNSELIAQINIFLRRKSSQELFDKDQIAFIEQQTNTYDKEDVNILSESVLVEENTTSLINNNNKEYSEESCEIKEEDYVLTEDISIQQTTNPLLTACIVYNWKTNNSESIVNEILENEILENKISKNEILDNEILDSDNEMVVDANKKRSRDSNDEESISKFTKFSGGVGGIDINSIKINDYTIAYHPLLPIYMITCSYNCNINSDLEGSMDYDDYLKYYNFLKKMTDVLLLSKYLGGGKNSKNVAKSYLIGLALREFLFTLNRHENGIKVICNNGENSILSNININEYQSFSLMNSMLSDYISGKIEETKEENEFGIKLLQSFVFKEFINKDVKIKEIIINTPENESIDNLKKKSLDLIIKIKNKIITDRNSDENTSISSSLTSIPSRISTGTSSEEQENMSQTNNSKKRQFGSIYGGVLKTKKRKYKRILKTKQRNSKNGKKGKNTKKKRKVKGNKRTKKNYYF